MPSTSYAQLSEKDRGILQANGCRATDWTQIRVAKGFDASRVVDTVFEGRVDIGSLSGSVTGPDGKARPAGVSRARLENVTIGDNCYVSSVSGRLANVDIESGVYIENVGTLACTGPTTFGNGHRIAVLNEGGGRELPITTETSAQIAYLTVMYRHDMALIARLEAMAKACAESKRSDHCRLGSGAVVVNCQEILNVAIGPYAVVNGALSLKEGTIDSSKAAPSRVGAGVTAEHFIFQQGSKVTDGAMIGACLVGEGTTIGKQFSAENSAFFANCEGFHSEVCSAFAGPYTVTHHRSTLLIAGMFSFFNAGSGTNQSNHMYKLGPLHQGILERGCKTGSSSYLLWPSRVGAFTAIIGKHYANFDTGDFPFSYINEDHGRSTLVPGMNFLTVGTLRDGQKWPSRDRRSSERKLDLITFDVLSPYTAQKMLRGQRILLELHNASEKGQEYVTYQGIAIKRLLLKTCSRYYALALDKYFGDVVVRRAEANPRRTLVDLLTPDAAGAGAEAEWLDLLGLLCPRPRVERLCADIASGAVADFGSLHAALAAIHALYRADEWNWFLNAWKCHQATDTPADPAARLHALLDNWKTSSIKLLNMVRGDAEKEFVGNVRTGFGIDGSADADFEAVRGSFEKNSFVRSLATDTGKIQQQYDALSTRIN
jgi:hypothetical protein